MRPFTNSPRQPFCGFTFPALFTAHCHLVFIDLIFKGKTKSQRAVNAICTDKTTQS